MATNVTMQRWDEAQREYRTLLQTRLARYLQIPAGQGDPNNQKPLNAIMAHVPMHLLEYSKTGVAEITITVKLMRGKTPVANSGQLCPTVKVNVDGRNNTPGREQLPHIGFSLRADGSGESHVFVRDPIPKGTAIRGKLGDEGQRYVSATVVTPRGPPSARPSDVRDEWHVTAEVRRFDQ